VTTRGGIGLGGVSGGPLSPRARLRRAAGRRLNPLICVIP
jgi:hypothetical protein